MKLKIRVRLVALCALSVGFADSRNTCGATEPSPALPTEKTSAVATATSPALTRAEALKIIAAARQYVAHPQPAPANGSPGTPATQSEPQVTTPGFEMAEPPPAPRAETKPAAPGPNYVWVAGHHMPVKGEWRWVQGEWAIPALPISVWVEARYDAKEKKWSPGYWQPDVAMTPPTELTTKPGTPPASTHGY